MPSLSITRAWNETAEFVRKEAGLLLPLAFMLVALPVALVEAVAPPPVMPGQAPPAGAWLALIPVVLLTSMIGNLAISYLAIRPGTSVGEAIGRGARRFLPLLAVAVLLMIAGAVAFFVAAMVMVILVPGAVEQAQGGVAGGAMATATVLTLVVLLPLLIYFGARLMLMTPIAAGEETGPIGLIRRSWALTRNHVWKLIAFMILVGITVGVVSGVIQMLAGILFALLLGPPEPGSTSALLVTLVMAAVNTVMTAYLGTFVARIYVQLAAGGEERAFT
jgi:hypothetical protein